MSTFFDVLRDSSTSGWMRNGFPVLMGKFWFGLSGQGENFGQKYDDSGDGGPRGADQDGCCGHVLCFSRQRMVLGRYQVGQVFEGGIQRFECQYQGDGKRYRHPFQCGYVEKKSGQHCRAAAARWMRALGWVRTRSIRPWKANRKLFIRF